MLFSSSNDKLYENIGIKVKSLAKCVFIIETIVAIIAGVSFMATDEDLLLSGFLSLICGPIIAWVSSWVLYAIGEAADGVRVQKNIEYSTSDGKYVEKPLCYDSEKKLWFTDSNNDFLTRLVDFYGVNEATSEKAMKLLKAKTEIQ